MIVYNNQQQLTRLCSFQEYSVLLQSPPHNNGNQGQHAIIWFCLGSRWRRMRRRKVKPGRAGRRQPRRMWCIATSRPNPRSGCRKALSARSMRKPSQTSGKRQDDTSKSKGYNYCPSLFTLEELSFLKN